MNCPECGSSDVARIQYGLPAGPPGPGVVLGGCVIGQGDPDRVCGACDHAWPVPRQRGDSWILEGRGYTATWASHQGLARRENQDAARCFEGRLAGRPVLVAAVFDGVGGLPGGKEAAHDAARRLKRVLRDAAGAELVVPELHAGLPTGATTATIACFFRDEPSAVLMHAGDSAAYVWSDGWTRITPIQDIDQALGMHPEPVVKRIDAPEHLLLATDGVIDLQEGPDFVGGPADDDATYVYVRMHPLQPR